MTIRTAATVVLVLLTGCAAPGGDADETGEAAANGNAVTGSVSYRERMALPQDATIEVWITDVSDSAAPGAMLAETAIEPEGRQVPIPFELRYDPAAVNADHTYAVKATIRSGGQIMFSTLADYYVITKGNPTAINLMLQRGTGGGDPTAGATPRKGQPGVFRRSAVRPRSRMSKPRLSSPRTAAWLARLPATSSQARS
jgi:putative lipoprotein